MTTSPSPAPAAGLPVSYDARLATRISEGVDRHLRMAAVLKDMRLGHLLDHLLDQALPTATGLAAQMEGTATDER